MTISRLAPLFILLGALCAFAAALPSAPRENIPVNSEVFVQPEYLEALDKELEKEVPIYGGSWWIHYQEEQRKNGGKNNPDNWHHGNLDHIGGGNLLKRNLDPIGGGNLLRRNLDQIGGGNLVKRYLDEVVDTADLLRSIDPIGGGKIFKRSLTEKPKPQRPSRPSSGHLDSIGDGYLIGR